MSASSELNIDEEKFKEFLGRVMTDIGGAWTAVLVYIGDKLGLYKAMLKARVPVTSDELAKLTGTSERYIREWLANQAASRYIKYDPVTEKYSLPPEHALALVDDKTPAYVIGSFQVAMSFFRDEPMISNAFRTGQGIDWDDRSEDLFDGTERYFKPIYSSHLTTSWIPSLQGLEEKLKKGCKVADVACGHGISTIIMSQAYPNSTFIGFDSHKSSIERARKIAEEEGLGKSRIIFDVASSTDYPGEEYDLITFFACLHDMGDPVAAANYALDSLKSDGALMVVEPFANNKFEDNLNPIGRLFYATSTLICIPTSLAQNGPALGAQAGEKIITEIIKTAGFKNVRCTAYPPYNLVFEARP